MMITHMLFKRHKWRTSDEKKVMDERMYLPEIPYEVVQRGNNREAVY